jgi:hypothetical protein
MMKKRKEHGWSKKNGSQKKKESGWSIMKGMKGYHWSIPEAILLVRNRRNMVGQ